MTDQVPDFNQLMKIAKQVASNMEPPPGIKKGKQITEKDREIKKAKITARLDKISKLLFCGSQETTIFRKKLF